ncbi:Carrier domain-containing protein [Sulfidibacter corallicola]|uniref:Carrier domain-containing protein n=1 Tax=Sulfidibacter corallicola TaxID=2818388 RepID=A0A8A4TVX4_SULCO|nr:phosphopantetheine-binding protein [Sulfidibacter corallicola]QTD53650.1 hypothetical protein J3U87_14445 [Sulfidibacter corallicola]
MNAKDIERLVFSALTDIAPEVDPEDLEPDEPIQEQIDFDSMDFRNLLLSLHESLNVDIPEKDYGRLRSVDELVDYLGARL